VDPATLYAMRDELRHLAPQIKLATQGYGGLPQEFEEMNAPRWKQTLKDMPIVIGGGALGYAAGRTGAEYLLPKLVTSPEALANVKKGLPAATAALGGLGAYLALIQHRMLKQRREQAAQRELGGTVTAEAEQPQQTPVNAPVDKLSGAPVPNVGPRRTDPWRTSAWDPYYTGPK
jgi:hypothetical protein